MVSKVFMREHGGDMTTGPRDAGAGVGMTDFLKEKAKWVRRETLKIHKMAQDTRVASSLSAVEIFTVLYYGGILKNTPKDLRSEKRDRIIVSKGHGAISLYPILADLGYFDKSELLKVCKEGTFLGGIPDSVIPGFETINGSLGHGIGVGCGMALALKRKNRGEKVVVIVGDGELYEGSIWEGLMFAGEHGIDNLLVIVDRNRVSMLDRCENIIDLEALDEKFRAFRWETSKVDGHDVDAIHSFVKGFKTEKGAGRPVMLIAETVKGKGVAALEGDPLSHIRNIKPDEVDNLLAGMDLI